MDRNPAEPLSYRVEKMRLTKDKTALVVNGSLTLAGIPPETFEYRLGNRSALEWVVDQYRVTEDERSGIRSGPQPRKRPALHRPPGGPGGEGERGNRPYRPRAAAGVSD